MKKNDRPTNIDLDSIREKAMEFAHIGIYRYRFNGEIIFIDRGTLTLLDLENEYPDPMVLVGKEIGSLFEYIDSPYSLRNAVSRQKNVRFFEYHYRTLSGKERWVYHSSYLVFDEKYGEEVIQVIAQDITKIKQTALALEESEIRYRTLAENTNQGIVVLAEDSLRPLYVNRRCADFWEMTDEQIMALEGEKLWEKVHPDDVSTLRENLANRQESAAPPNNYDLRFLRDNNELLWLKFLVVPIRFGGENALQFVLTDITKRKNRERLEQVKNEKLQQAQKLESLSVLAGGVAHDFNNLLVGILGNAELALMSLQNDSSVRENIRGIERAAKQAAELANQMLAFAGKGSFSTEIVNLETHITAMTKLLRSSISRKVEFNVVLDDTTEPIKIDLTQLRQVIMNLVINASEAIGDRDGTISIHIGTTTITNQVPDDIFPKNNLIDRRYSYLEVTDTGCGMDQETKIKIFDPFFTTKFPGRGLGLAAVLGIVRGCRGTIQVLSEPGKGTTIKVFFPTAEMPKSLDSTHENDPDNSSLKGKKILVVDDEPMVRAVGTDLLERFGADAVCAEDGIKALELFKKNPQQFDCILLDHAMPHMDGKETFKRLKGIKDDVIVIMSSGYTELDLQDKLHGSTIAGFIQKPYEANKLKAALVDALKKPK